jgi:hypothetical protein
MKYKVTAIITEIFFAMMIATFHDLISPSSLEILALGDAFLFLMTLSSLLRKSYN